MVHGCTWLRDPPRAFVTSAVSTLALFRQFVSSSRETAVRWKLEFSTSHRARRTSLKFASESVTLMDPNVRKGRLRWKRIASGTQRTLWNTGNSKGYRALCSGKGGRGVRMWSLVATHQGRELTARGRRRKIIKSDRGARGERKREHLEISERYPTNYFSPVVCCLKGQDTRHIARDGGEEKGGRRAGRERSNGNQCRQIPPFPREQSLVKARSFIFYSPPLFSGIILRLVRSLIPTDAVFLRSSYYLWWNSSVRARFSRFHSAAREFDEKRWTRSKNNI